MKVFLLAAFLTVASCGHINRSQPPSTPSPVTETVTVQIGPPTSVPLIPTKSVQCLHNYLKASWPVEEVVNTWNRNGVNLLLITNDPRETCDNHVIVQEVPSMGGAWGETRYVPGTATTTLLEAATPARLRRHVLCHELGHVLGLGHEQGSTCMNVNQEVPLPSDQDLQTLKKVWNWDSASISYAVH